MRSFSSVPFLLLLCGLLATRGRPLHAQAVGFDASYGLWWSEDSTATTFAATLHQRLLGPLGYSVGFTHLDDNRSEIDKTASGAEVGLSLWRDGSGPYVLGSVGFGLLHRTRALDAVWSAGGGYLQHLFSGVSVGLEARYRVEDPDIAGFWRLNPGDRRGVMLQGRLAISLGGRPARGGGTVASAPAARPESPPPPPTLETAEALARNRGASDEAARTTAGVVETALAVMGTPYQWGGSGANGFDCSGLIQYAYGEHGVILPRVSRDQMRMGTRVDPSLDALRPGDLLGFSVEGTSQITHIGLYLGEGQFIHSASDGVKLSSLTATDPDSRWWRDRWVAARRIVE